MASTFHLIVAIPDEEPISYAIKDESVKIGRSPDNDIQILIREVSTSHCELVGDADGYEIVDPGSSNGTRVKGQSIRNGRVFLNDRDKILIGETVPAYFVAMEEGEKFSAKAIIAEVEATTKAKEEPVSESSAAEEDVTPVVATPVAAAATPVEEARSAAPTQVLKKSPALPGAGPKPGLPAKKAPTLPKLGAGGEKPKIPALSKPAAKAGPVREEAAEPEQESPKSESPKLPPIKKAPATPVAVQAEAATPAKPKVPALKKPALAAKEVKPAREETPRDKPKLPVVQKLKAPTEEPSEAVEAKTAAPLLAKTDGAPKKVPSLSKPGVAPKLATPSVSNSGNKKVPKLNLPKKGE